MRTINLNAISIGSDPEYAAIDQNGTPRSAVGYIPGTKSEPFPLDDKGEFSIQIDNVGVEACIPPAYSREEFVNSMMTAKELTQKKLQEQRPSLVLQSLSSARYSEAELNSETAQTFGCDPSWCAHTGEVSHRPSPVDVGNLRSFGCHIHIGFKTTNDASAMDTAINIIKAMDIMCGLGSVLLDQDADRRSIYGNAGDFRFRQIEDLNIVEYRTLGGAMHDNAELLGWVYDQTIKAVQMADTWEDIDMSVIEFAINEGDTELCQELLSHYQIELPYAVRTAKAINA